MECCYTQCCLFILMLSVIMPCIAMLIIVAPLEELKIFEMFHNQTYFLISREKYQTRQILQTLFVQLTIWRYCQRNRDNVNGFIPTSPLKVCHNIQQNNTQNWVLLCRVSHFHYYAEFHYVECRYPECCCAIGIFETFERFHCQTYFLISTEKYQPRRIL